MVAPILSPADLQDISDALAPARPDVCLIRRRSGAVDAGGALQQVWTTHATVACRVDAAVRLPQETLFGGRVTPAVPYTVALPYGTDIRADDRIQVHGIDMEVVGVPGLASFAPEVVVTVYGVL